MKYIKIDNNKWIEYNPVNSTSRVLIKDDLELQITLLNSENEKLNKITEEQLLEWAKEHYYGSQDFKTYTNNLTKISMLEETLTKLI